ncbi:hypothetical protein M0805_004409 [Coniferiporia weirii]|nr:hypothetical protein M0805_004409 [Coniferiporia weirii]
MPDDNGSETSPEDSSTTHFVRITSGGKIRLWVDFSLKFLQENPGRPLTLHTLPPGSLTNVVSVKTAAAPLDEIDRIEDRSGQQTPQDDLERRNKSCPSTSNIPRLISVVEIIKREYLKTKTPDHSSTGLFQYNRLGILEELESSTGAKSISSEEEHRQNEISAVIEGNNYPRQVITPYMQVTLCTSALPAMEGETTAQPPSVRKVTKSSKTRLRRRLKKKLAKEVATT